jgi:BirA family biotin operon repressor/biotin-[acetyl-CoA-carboxylase] ligase
MTANWLDSLRDRPYRVLARIGSTNDEAAAWALTGAPDGALVIADEQTAGRGRHGRVWQAAPGSALLMSIVLRPAIPAEMLPRTTLMAAVAVAEALAALGTQPGIKWPNDVLIGGRKVAGILAEATWEGDRLAAVVLGIGVNVRRDALPEEMATAFGATTLQDALARPVARGDVLAALVAGLDRWRGQLGDPALLAAWRDYSITLGRAVTVTAGATVLRGVAEDIDASGALLLRQEGGRLQRLLAGEVTLRDA